jgi:hypothetical protein
MVQLYEGLEAFLVLYMWTRDHNQVKTSQVNTSYPDPSFMPLELITSNLTPDVSVYRFHFVSRYFLGHRVMLPRNHVMHI